MSTPINLATEVYLANNVAYTGGSIVPTNDPPGLAGSVILTAPVLGAGGTGVLHVTGILSVDNTYLGSAPSPDAAGWLGAAYDLFLSSGVTDFSPVLRTVDLPFGTGLESYDAAVAAGQVFVLLNPGNLWHSITAVSYDYTEPGGFLSAPRRRHSSPLRRYPRSPLRRYPPPPSTQDSNRRAGGYQ